MFKYENPAFFQAFWALPVLLLLLGAYLYWRNRAILKIGPPDALEPILPVVRSGKSLFFKNFAALLAIGLLILAAANPQRGARKQKIRAEGADVIIALDISQSMLCEDLAPSRLELAKNFSRKLVNALVGERIGLVFFSGNAFLQMPLSTDYEAAQMFIREADPYMLSDQGTDIGQAIALARRSFDPDPGAGRALIIITDGENHESEAIDQARGAYDDGIVVFAVGAGTSAGGYIPTGPNAFKRDENNEVITTRMNETLIRELAEAGQGAGFFLENSESALAGLKIAIDQLQKREIEVRSFTEFESYFQWLLFPAILLLLLPFLRPPTPAPAKSSFLGIFRLPHSKTSVILLFFFLAPSAGAQSPHRALRDGDRNYRKKDFKEAEEAYRSAGDTPKAWYNLGNSLYRQGKYEEAVPYFNKAAEGSPEPAYKADALHNLGNTYLQQRQFDKAVEAYERSLRLRPGDPETKVNLQLAKKHLPPPPPQNQEQPQEQQQPSGEGEQEQPQPPRSGEGANEQQSDQSEQPRSDDELMDLLRNAVGKEDARNARKYRERERPEGQRKHKKDW